MNPTQRPASDGSPVRAPSSVLVFIALGSNLGDSARTIREAMDRLEILSAAPLRRSTLWQSTPVDCPADAPPFINAVVALTPLPGETPELLLAKLRAREADFGRAAVRVLNESRTLDLDIIAWGEVVQNTDTLTIPHPRAHRRRFVLQPLAELAPDFTLPGQGKSVARLLAELDSTEKLRVWEGLNC